MINKQLFLDNEKNNLPFFLRNYKIKEFIINGNVNNSDCQIFQKNTTYDSESVKCRLPLKPISKILTSNEQNDF